MEGREEEPENRESVWVSLAILTYRERPKRTIHRVKADIAFKV